MPRKARLDVPGALHHIIVRGINKAAIFNDDQDKTLFVERLSENIIQGQCKVYAWVLMTNHIHLLFKSGKDGISAVMRKQLTWYAQYYNRVIKGPDISSRTDINRSSVTRKRICSRSYVTYI